MVGVTWLAENWQFAVWAIAVVVCLPVLLNALGATIDGYHALNARLARRDAVAHAITAGIIIGSVTFIFCAIYFG